MVSEKAQFLILSPGCAGKEQRARQDPARSSPPCRWERRLVAAPWAGPSSPAAPRFCAWLKENTPALPFKTPCRFPGEPAPWSLEQVLERHPGASEPPLQFLPLPARVTTARQFSLSLPLIFFLTPPLGTFLEPGVQDSAGQRAFVKRLAGEGRAEILASGGAGTWVISLHPHARVPLES